MNTLIYCIFRLTYFGYLHAIFLYRNLFENSQDEQLRNQTVSKVKLFFYFYHYLIDIILNAHYQIFVIIDYYFH